MAELAKAARHIKLCDVEALPNSGVFGRDIAIADYRRHLGRSHNILAWDASKGLHPNAFAAMLGSVEAGGEVQLYLPTYYPDGDPDHCRSLDYGHDPKQCATHFNQRLRNLIAQSEASANNNRNDNTSHTTPANHKAAHFTLVPQAIIGRRGRGKSTWLGRKICWLKQRGIDNILVVAPYRDNISSLSRAALGTPFTFLAPDDALYRQPNADYLIIDEASAIPIAQLNALLDRYPAYSLAATVDGYEGHGQRLRLQCLNQRNICTIHLTDAYRYNAFDSLECFSEAAFLLHQTLSTPPSNTAFHLTIEEIDTTQLIHNEMLLRQIMALLQQAHYRNTPADLKRLLDLPLQHLWIAQSAQQVIGVLHIVIETPLPSALIEAIISGNRRPQGRILMQQLLRHCKNPGYGQYNIARIQRIATHPAYRRQGIASRLIHAAQSTIPCQLGASHAHSPALAAFWSSIGFKEIYRSTQQRSRQMSVTSLRLHTQ